MSVEQAKAAHQAEYVPFAQALKNRHRNARNASVNLQVPQWSTTVDVPTKKTEMVDAFEKVSHFPIRGIVKRGTQDISCYQRAKVLRTRTRLKFYALNRVRRDIMESVVSLRAKVESDMTG